MGSEKKRTPHWPSYARALKREAGRWAGGDFDSLIGRARHIEDPYYRAQALGWIARRMEGAEKERARVFSEAAEAAKEVQQEWRRGEVLGQIASEMSKGGAGGWDALLGALDTIRDPKHRLKALDAVRRRMAGAGIAFPKIPREAPREKRKRAAGAPPTRKPRRITLGLLNTYRGRTLGDAHIRAVARAAPLCYAYGLNLGLFGFPLADAGKVISRVERESRVGEGKVYLRRLFSEGRVIVLALPKEAVLPGLGEIVATTSNPEPEKRIQLDRITKKNRPFCILVGLGSRGLPKRVLRLSRHHLELTGKGIPLETCTAMGVLAALLSPSG